MHLVFAVASQSSLSSQGVPNSAKISMNNIFILLKYKTIFGLFIKFESLVYEDELT